MNNVYVSMAWGLRRIDAEGVVKDARRGGDVDVERDARDGCVGVQTAERDDECV